MSAPDWLVARPIAHRGLHDRAAGIIENTRAAARAAVAHGFPIECDVQLAADGDAMVFHDDGLERLVGRSGLVRETSAQALCAMPLEGAEDGETIPTLAEFLATLAGRTPLVLEIKSRFDGDMRLTRRTLDLLAEYAGPVAVKSFDPGVVAQVRAAAPHLPRGFIGEATYAHPSWDGLSPVQKHAFANLLHYDDMQPHFLSWSVRDLPCGAPHLCRRLVGMPVMAWTVRDPETRASAAAYADQMVFEGFLPRAPATTAA